MLQQKVQNRPLKPLQGVGVVLAVMAAVLLGSAAFTRLASRIGTLASLGFILYGMAVAWLLLNEFVLAFSYRAGGDCLRISRAYGRYERFMDEIWFSSVLGYGDPESLRKRFPEARVDHADRPRCALEPLALAHRDGDKVVVTVIQPDDRLRAHIMKILKK